MSEVIGKMFGWFNSRLPIVNTFERHLSKHPVPSLTLARVTAEIKDFRSV
jgi:hypothetical protein